MVLHPKSPVARVSAG